MNHTTSCFKGLAIMVLLLCAAVTAMAEPAAAEKKASKTVLQGMININKADAAQFELLPGIGAKTADSIVAYRTGIGAFSSIDDLVKVKGIGQKTLEKLRPYLSLEGETTLQKVKQS